MGQKTHPKGLRLEVNKNWTSNWFPKKNAYANDLAQDIKLRKYLKKRLQDASDASVIIERNNQTFVVQQGALLENKYKLFSVNSEYATFEYNGNIFQLSTKLTVDN